MWIYVQFSVPLKAYEIADTGEVESKASIASRNYDSVEDDRVFDRFRYARFGPSTVRIVFTYC